MATQLYYPLDAALWQFRVLRLLPGQRGSVIEGELQLHKIVTPPKYVALSYCWGDESHRRPAVINQRTISIAANLEAALQHLRAAGVELVWADALCINQRDIQERSLQVRFIKQIYTKSIATYAWLGEPHFDNAANGLKFLECISTRALNASEEATRRTHLTWGFWRGRQSGISQRVRGYGGDRTGGDYGIGLVDYDHSFAAILDVLNRPYWQRRWIIQEAASSVTTRVMCGDFLISIDTMSQALQECKKNKTRWSAQHETSHRFFGRVKDMRRAYHDRKRPGLFEAIFETKDSLSKDDRDKVFALLGICHDGDALVSTPNYEESLESLNINLTTEILRRNAAFEIILVDQRTRSSQHLLPSWCPDWLSGELSEYAHLTAQRPERLALSYAMSSLIEDPQRLHVQGMEFGRVVARTSILDRASAPTNPTGTGIPSRTATHAAQMVKYYGWMHRAALASCLRASTRSPQSLWTSSRSFIPLIYNLSLHHMLIINENNPRTNRPDWCEPTWPFLLSWLLTNGDFMFSGQNLDSLTSSWPTSLSRILVWCVRPSSYAGIAGMGLNMLWLTATVLVMELSLTLSLFLLIGLFVPGMRRLLKAQKWQLGLGIIACLGSVLCASLGAYTNVMLDRLRLEVEEAARGASLSRARLVVLDNGAIALACADVDIGDKICFILGCDSSAVLRSARHGSQPSGEDLLSVIGRSFVVLSNKDAKRYKAFCEVAVGTKWKRDRKIGQRSGAGGLGVWMSGEKDSDIKEYNELIEKYKQYPEWRQFVLI